ncbi:MAG TPA: WYL domain-containing protein [Phycisphaerae bacterium]|nr:WYL domain-containing protein [Phycisphaerae bacterium]HOI54518.1 WYL domain-containing protein [Phycisphaerae bacterium]
MDISRLHRVLKIITLLQTRRYYSVESLADELEVSRRTIYRDLNMLELAGVPFYYDRSRRGYIIHQTYWLPPINLDLEEALSLIAVAAAAGDESGVPLLGKASDAARKIESQLPLTIRAAVGQAASGLTVRRSPVARHEGLEGAYHTVREAVARRHVLRGRYISFYEKKQIDVTMEPYWLVFHERAWYVIGRCCRNDDIRTFKLGRFVELRELAETFKAPARTLEEHLGNAWRFMPEGRQYDVSLRFSRLVAPNVAEVQWHRTQKVAWEDEGTLLFDVRVDGLGEIYWWVLGYGDQVEVLKPKALRDRIRKAAENTLARYRP